MSLPTTSNNNMDRLKTDDREETANIGQDRRFYRARNGREDTFDFTIEEPQLVGPRYHLKDRAFDGHRRWNGRAHRRSIINSERKGEIEEAAIDRKARRMIKNREIDEDRSGEIDENVDERVWVPCNRYHISTASGGRGRGRSIINSERRLGGVRMCKCPVSNVGSTSCPRVFASGGRGRGRSIINSERNGEIKEAAIDRLMKARRMKKNREIVEDRNGEIDENVDERGNTRCNAPFWCMLILNDNCKCTCSCSKKKPTRPSRPSPPEDNDYRGA